MSFRLRWTSQATETFEELHEAAERAASTRAQETRVRGKRKTKSSKQEGLFKQVAKAVSQLAANPRHSSLHTHEYHSLSTLRPEVEGLRGLRSKQDPRRVPHLLVLRARQG